MILDERQYLASKASIRRFEEQITELERRQHDLDNERRETLIAAYRLQIRDIETEIADYETHRRVTPT